MTDQSNVHALHVRDTEIGHLTERNTGLSYGLMVMGRRATRLDQELRKTQLELQRTASSLDVLRDKYLGLLLTQHGYVDVDQHGEPE